LYPKVVLFSGDLIFYIITIQGGSPLGFLNYWLYQNGASNPQIFNDITSGSNPGCGTNGFQAAKGWDPAVSFSSFFSDER